MHRPDWFSTSVLRYSLFPTVSGLAERFTIRLQPARARMLDGGIGIHRSSQTSTPTSNSVCFHSFTHLKIRSVPNGTSSDAYLRILGTVALPLANQRDS